MRTTLLFGVLVTTASAVAQSWAVSAQAPVQGTASVATVFGAHTATLPAGPVPAGSFLVCNNGFGNVGAIWSPSVPFQVAPLAFAASCTWASTAIVGVVAGMNADLDLTLQAPQPTGGWLRLRTWPNQVAYVTAHIVDVDLGADGIVDYHANGQQQADLPLQIPANGVVVRLSLRLHAMYYNLMSGALGVTAEFFPEPTLSVFDTMGAGTALTWQQTPGQTTLTLDPTTTPLLMAFGAQPVSIPLFPTVTLLVTPDVLLATGSVTLPATVPPGTSIYAQGLVLDATNTLRSSNSVRVFWP